MGGGGGGGGGRGLRVSGFGPFFVLGGDANFDFLFFFWGGERVSLLLETYFCHPRKKHILYRRIESADGLLWWHRNSHFP